jgi:hypothetical protein
VRVPGPVRGPHKAVTGLCRVGDPHDPPIPAAAMRHSAGRRGGRAGPAGRSARPPPHWLPGRASVKNVTSPLRARAACLHCHCQLTVCPLLCAGSMGASRRLIVLGQTGRGL